MSSKPFEFLVGPEKKVFTIHSALVACQSAVLAQLINGDMKEATEGSVVWEHVDEQTFIRFSQYAYMGIYRYPSFRPGPPDKADCGNAVDNPQTNDGAVFVDVWSFPTKKSSQSKMKKKKKSSESRIRGYCEACDEPITEPEPEPEPEQVIRYKEKGKGLWASFEKQLSSTEPYMVMRQALPRDDGEDNDAELLLCHARLYVFADCYDITPLMRLSLCTLHHVLVKVPQSDDMTRMVVKLLRYCYENDMPDALKDVVVGYAACRVEHLWKSEDFQLLMCDHGNLGVALVGALLARID
ncbi:hypothetical protein E4U21_003329 [Claviceps maximensis]|nr:hypothetical protein E4U21_003329 [Claviceps maximensis]